MQRILETSRGKFKGNVMKTRLGVVEDQTDGMIGGKRQLIPIKPTTNMSQRKYYFEVTNRIANPQTSLFLDLIFVDSSFKDRLTAQGSILYISEVFQERDNLGQTLILKLLCSGKTFFMKCSVAFLLLDPVNKTLIENEVAKYNKIKQFGVENLFPKHLAHGRMFVQNRSDSYTSNLEVVILEDVGMDMLNIKLDVDMQKKVHLFTEAVKILKKLHQKGICHSDSKLDNFALNENGVIKLLDPEYMLDVRNLDKDLATFAKLKDLNQLLLSHTYIWNIFQNSYPTADLSHIFDVIKQRHVDEKKKSFFPWDKVFLRTSVFLPTLLTDQESETFKAGFAYFKKLQTNIDMDLIYETFEDPQKVLKMLDIIYRITWQIKKSTPVQVDESYVFYTHGTDDPVTATQPSNPARPQLPQQQQQQIVQYHEYIQITIDSYVYNFKIVKDPNGSIILDPRGSPIYSAVNFVSGIQMWYRPSINHIFLDFNSAMSVY